MALAFGMTGSAAAWWSSDLHVAALLLLVVAGLCLFLSWLFEKLGLLEVAADDRSPARKAKDDEIRRSVETEGTTFSRASPEERARLIELARQKKQGQK